MSAVEQGGLWNEEREEKGRKEAEADICKEGRTGRQLSWLPEMFHLDSFGFVVVPC